MPVVIWERWIAYGMCTGDTDFCIDHLQHTDAEVIVEDMGAFEEDGDRRCNLSGTIALERPRLIIECCVPAGIHI